MRLSVKPDKSVLVSYPGYVSPGDALKFVAKNSAWISRQQEKMNLRKTFISPGTELQTKLYKIRFSEGFQNKTWVQKEVIHVEIKNFNSDEAQEYITHLLTETYRMEAQKLLPQRLEKLAGKFGFRYNKISIRNNRSNWGSCSSKNNISLNLQMMKLPDILIDYILLHELVHTEIKNHGSGFWARLNQITNNQAVELSRQVKKYSTYIL